MAIVTPAAAPPVGIPAGPLRRDVPSRPVLCRQSAPSVASPWRVL